jgi:hypothetical protein
MKTLEELKREEYTHVSDVGGWLELGESDRTINDGNREQIASFKREHGAAWLGNINFYDEQRRRIASGMESVYEEYTRQMVYNFGCAFCVPVPDETLSNLIREWNTDYKPGISNSVWNQIDAITNAVSASYRADALWILPAIVLTIVGILVQALVTARGKD